MEYGFFCASGFDEKGRIEAIVHRYVVLSPKDHKIWTIRSWMKRYWMTKENSCCERQKYEIFCCERGDSMMLNSFKYCLIQKYFYVCTPSLGKQRPKDLNQSILSNEF